MTSVNHFKFEANLIRDSTPRREIQIRPLTITANDI